MDLCSDLMWFKAAVSRAVQWHSWRYPRPEPTQPLPNRERSSSGESHDARTCAMQGGNGCIQNYRRKKATTTSWKYWQCSFLTGHSYNLTGKKKKKANKTNQETFVCCQMQVAEKQAEFLSYHTTWVNSPKNNYCSFKKKFSIPRGEVINQTDQGP